MTMMDCITMIIMITDYMTTIMTIETSNGILSGDDELKSCDWLYDYDGDEQW